MDVECASTPCLFPVSLLRIPSPCPFSVSLARVPSPYPFSVSLPRIPTPYSFPVPFLRALLPDTSLSAAPAIIIRSCIQSTSEDDSSMT
ncbi:hypothetical protein AUEXF2481DRAFT_204583 [Aureobasidium subglaciale EXF-2481]|uniref:Uncharacterized protein n=1 Tax=Aureobasidium subglaciale (strain EXF-2481) TaxID=1043005 RepID=A0A074YQ58_AURSE|nr:uncharacterized protein AUEXF2481DRAFT_204583 [Aureobasidium subglaciale EXF-2481]KEQ99923.1 hypothetical protein AUEXF2481DRAFT_204583 [Aureobasidium subglaciale EXF-2481]